MKKRACLNIIFIFIFGFCTCAQQKEFEFKNLTQENGLPSNEAYFIYRDSRNFLWVATDQGVVRYNGNKMEFFNLPDNVIFKIYEDSKGRVWFFSHTGKLAYFFNGLIYGYKYNNNIISAFKSILITNAYVNDDDEIIGNSSPQNFRISKTGAIQKFDYLKYNKKDSCFFEITRVKDQQYFTQCLSTNYISSDTVYIKLMAQGGYKNFKAPIIQGLYSQYGCVTANGKDFFFFYGKTIIKLKEDCSFITRNFSSIITSLEIDKENIWAGFIKDGAFLLDTGLNILSKDPALNNKSVTSIRKDYEGGIWFSTLEKGVYYMKSSHVSHLAGDSSFTRPVFRILTTGDSSLLFANTNGVYKISDNLILPVLHQAYNKVTDMLVDNNKNLYVSGVQYTPVCNDGVYKNSINGFYKNVFSLTSVSEMIHARENIFLMSTYEGIRQFDKSSVQHNTENTNCLTLGILDFALLKPGILFYDSKKQFWIGTIDALYKFGSLNSTPLQFKPNDTLFKKGVTCMRQLDNGIYAIGIRFGGIALMHDTSIIATITQSEGLLNNSVKYILPLKDQIWAATSEGISIINFKSYNPVRFTITNIGKNSGLYNVIIYQLMQYQGNILAATSNGIYEISNPAQFINNPAKPIPFYINSINYYKGDTSDIRKIILPYDKSRIIIKYAAVCYNLPEKLKYYYRLDNIDTSWHEIASTEFLMEKLTPGNYYLELKASIMEDQRFSDIQKLQIIVEKPWWQNNWFRLIAVIFLLATIYFIYKKRIDSITFKEKRTAALNTRMVELEQMALRSQMNPHFIFNCLTSIQQLIISGNKTEANEYLIKFARLIRKTLELSASSFITIEDEIDYIKEYLTLEQFRNPSQFEFSIDIDVNINVQKTEIPGMMLQPILENSIRHGIKHLENTKGKIDISLKDLGQYILCTILDNGVGRTKSGESKVNFFIENKSYGMEIISKRLSAITFHRENEGTLYVEDLFNKDGSSAGTKVTMQLPFKIKQL